MVTKGNHPVLVQKTGMRSMTIMANPVKLEAVIGFICPSIDLIKIGHKSVERHQF